MLLQGLKLLTQTRPVRREESVLLNHFADPLQQLGHTNRGAVRHEDISVKVYRRIISSPCWSRRIEQRKWKQEGTTEGGSE